MRSRRPTDEPPAPSAVKLGEGRPAAPATAVPATAVPVTAVPPTLRAMPPERRSWRRPSRHWILPFLLISLLLHLLPTLVLLLWPAPPSPLDARAESPAEMAFEIVPAPDTAMAPPPGADQPPSAATPPPTSPQPAPPEETPPPPAPPTQAPPTPPTPPSPPAPAPPPPAPPTVAPPPEPEPPPPTPAPPEPQPQPPPPPPPLPAPEPAPAPPPPPPQPPPPTPRPPPAVRLGEAPPRPPVEFNPPVFEPQPLPPPPAPRPTPPPQPRPTPRATPPRFPNTGDYFFAPPAPRPGRTARGQAGSPLNLAIGPVEQYTADAPRRNASDRDSDIQVTGAQVGSDWLSDLHKWWTIHRHYPEQAGENGESGTVQIHVKVDRTGRVLGVDLVSTSGSQWLDLGALGTFRGARLPPFPTNTPENQADLTLTITYQIIR